MSSRGITGPQNQSSPNLGKKCPSARPLTTQNFVAIRQEVFELSAIQNLCLLKKWTHHAIFHQDRSDQLGEKRYKIFLHPSIIWFPSRTPWTKGHQSGSWCTSTPPLATWKILTLLRDICCQHDSHKKNKKNTYSKSHVSALHVATKIILAHCKFFLTFS